LDLDRPGKVLEARGKGHPAVGLKCAVDEL
jgi:hypothetical protein